MAIRVGGPSTGRAFGQLPIPRLKPGIGFADVVQKDQCGKSLHIDSVQLFACRVLQRATHTGAVQQRDKTVRHIGHVVQQRVDAGHRASHTPRQLAPGHKGQFRCWHTVEGPFVKQATNTIVDPGRLQVVGNIPQICYKLCLLLCVIYVVNNPNFHAVKTYGQLYRNRGGAVAMVRAH